jgi:hypothetical protein
MVAWAVACGFAGPLLRACSVSDRQAPLVAALCGTSVARMLLAPRPLPGVVRALLSLG